MIKQLLLLIFISIVLLSCNNNEQTKTIITVNDTVISQITDSSETNKILQNCINDSLSAITNIMSGISDTNLIAYNYIQHTKDYIAFNKNFDNRWVNFDSSRLNTLRDFREQELAKNVTTQTTLFYPFSGPDILYAQTFFPNADKYVMIGLEPVGSFPSFKIENKDSLKNYFNKINTSLNAILKFSFFRTISMSSDLKNTDVDGTLHLLTLFLKRTKNKLCSAKAITIDSLGNTIYLNSFADLKKLSASTKGVEIIFTDVNGKSKTLYYFSLNAANGGLKTNKGFVTYLQNMGTITTYLKGASYLMHKDYFSIICNIVLNQSRQIIQDDSGIALHYYTSSNFKWKYTFYGNYTKPIPMFVQHYQADLDSLYKQQGSKPIGFGIGYNFRDKNSNFMIATKQL